MSLDVRRVGADAAAEVLRVIRDGVRRPPGPRPARRRAGRDRGDRRRRARVYGGLLATPRRRTGRRAALPTDVPGDDAMMLRRFGVVPAAQGHGVAQALVQARRRRHPRRAALAVLAREELPATIGFWEQHGFVQVERALAVRRAAALARRRRWTRRRRRRMRALGERLGRSLHAGDLRRAHRRPRRRQDHVHPGPRRSASGSAARSPRRPS